MALKKGALSDLEIQTRAQIISDLATTKKITISRCSRTKRTLKGLTLDLVNTPPKKEATPRQILALPDQEVTTIQKILLSEL